MNNKNLTNLVALLLAASVLLASCAGAPPAIIEGEVISLYHQTAEWIIDGCMNGACSSEIFTNGKLVVYARPFVENVAFVVTSKGIPTEKLTGVLGNLVNVDTWGAFKEWMVANGYKIVTAGMPAYRTFVDVASRVATMELAPIFYLDVEDAQQIGVTSNE
jgi:hypothetical protein